MKTNTQAHTLKRDGINILCTLTCICTTSVSDQDLALHTTAVVKLFKPLLYVSSGWLKHVRPITGHWHSDCCEEHFIWCRQIIAYTLWNNITHSSVHTLSASTKANKVAYLSSSSGAADSCAHHRKSAGSHYTEPSKHAAATLTDNVFACATAMLGDRTCICTDAQTQLGKLEIKFMWQNISWNNDQWSTLGFYWLCFVKNTCYLTH